ncbi:MAG: GNAT family N-acetyltransferase [Armatimonadetes bacterium]|nr:GNAT family N-acetyltransferase [Anaerolineae bacterium]
MFVYRVDHETELRLFEDRHTEDLFDLTDANRVHLREWLMWADDIGSMSDSRAFIRDGLRQFADNDGFQAGIWYQGDLVGCIGLHRINWSDRNTEIGYWLAQAYTGRGIATRATAAMVDYAMNVYRLHRVIIRCAAGNLKSRAIPERLGFTLEGVLRHDTRLHHEYIDHMLYSMLSDEWWDWRQSHPAP